MVYVPPKTADDKRKNSGQRSNDEAGRFEKETKKQVYPARRSPALLRVPLSWVLSLNAKRNDSVEA
jgi:hypothetical protein